MKTFNNYLEVRKKAEELAIEKVEHLNKLSIMKAKNQMDASKKIK